jgi:hypothetical protein
MSTAPILIGDTLMPCANLSCDTGLQARWATSLGRVCNLCATLHQPVRSPRPWAARIAAAESFMAPRRAS